LDRVSTQRRDEAGLAIQQAEQKKED